MAAAEVKLIDDDGIGDSGLPVMNPRERSFRIGFTVMALSLVSGLATYLILTGLTPIVPRNEIVVGVLFINVVLIIAMIAVIAWQVSGLWRAWRNKVAGTRLHVRIIALFSIIAALPAILLAVAATTTFSRALDNWFSTRTREIIANSLDVANAYLEEHGQVIRTDIVNMAKDIDSAAYSVAGNMKHFQELVALQAGLRDLPVAIVVDGTGKIIVQAIEDTKIQVQVPPADLIELAAKGQVPLLMPNNAFRVAALARFNAYPDWYLYVARGVSPRVVGQLQRTQAGVAEYEELRKRRGGLKAAHGLMYFMISLTALLAAIWVGLWFASRFVAPIRRLIAAAQEVAKGNLLVELPERRGEGDLRRLSADFNTMTGELKSQRDALVAANEEMQERRRFMEAVLGGVSAGVIGLDEAGCITVANRSAEKLLGLCEADLVGRPLGEAVPAFAALLEGGPEVGLKPRPQDQVTTAVGEEERTFAVRITREEAGEDAGAVVTFDDITELVSAQRTSAWADVARRIAHEIKNPLTPIQLSAERIRRKYSKVITEDRETFDRLTETIERQAGHIKGMVDEFASFARMPKPEIAPGDLREAVRGPVILFREGHQDLDYRLVLPDQPLMALVDHRLISQAVTNLVKNATEAVEAAIAAGDVAQDYRGEVETRLSERDGFAIIEVIDNGTGLGKQNRSRLLEPYVTTKAKGTGLGLAIVQKIVEQHDGVLTLEDAPAGERRKRGALVRIALPLQVSRTIDGPAAKVAAE